MRLARYSREFGEASHIFLENGLWQVSASLASLPNTAWRMSASLASPRNRAGRMSPSLASNNINTKRAADLSASTRNIRKICNRKINVRVAIAYY